MPDVSRKEFYGITAFIILVLLMVFAGASPISDLCKEDGGIPLFYNNRWTCGFFNQVKIIGDDGDNNYTEMVVNNDGSINVNSTNLPLEENGAIAVNVQDQTTRPFAIKINRIINYDYSLTSVPTINAYDLTLNTTSGLVVGDNIAFLEQNGMPQLLFGEILNISGNVITLDTPIPWNFTPSRTVVFEYSNNFNVDGSLTTQTFAITNFFQESVDITRVIWHCTDATSMDDSKFCGSSALTRGIVFRKKKADGNYINYWNVKTNGEWGELAYDKSYDDKAPAGLYGLTSRLTYGGQSKHGVVIRLAPNESIELLAQDDLTVINTGTLMVEGHFVQN